MKTWLWHTASSTYFSKRPVNYHRWHTVAYHCTWHVPHGKCYKQLSQNSNAREAMHVPPSLQPLHHFFLLIMLNCFLSVAARSSVVVQWRRHGGGGANGATCPPPQPAIGHAVRSMQIREDFHVGKNRGRFPGFAPTFYMNRRYGGRSLVLWLRKRGSCKSCWRSYFGRPSVKLWGPLWSFSPGIGPPKHDIFFFIFLFCRRALKSK